ncbi:MAG: chromate transporter [Aquabacterium sp.]|nr:chromate transporter [Ferruginibacter sp.]
MLYFLKLGTTGFGGPPALIGYMHRDLVEKRKWIRDEDYKDGLALAQLAPGPLAAQLAIYLGYVHYRILGATVTGLAFVLPSFIMVVFLGMAYTHYGGLPWMQAVFYGISASVIGIIAFSSYKLTKKSIGNNITLWCIFGVSAAVTIITRSENVLLFIGAGMVYLLIKLPPKFASTLSNIWLMPFVLLQVPLVNENDKLARIFIFFAKAGAFVFGSGLAIIPFLYAGVVKENAWLNEQQFLDAVAVAMITPGPVVITVGFIGYLVAGLPGAAVAATATFLPCYLFTVLPAPYFKKYGKNPSLKAFVDGVIAAAIGAIAGAVVILGIKSITDMVTLAIALLTILVLWRFKKIQEPVVIVIAAVIGLILKYKTL